MTFKVEAQTFNGETIYPQVDIYIELNEKDKILPKGIYSEIRDEVGNNDFKIISNDLERLEDNKIIVKYESLKNDIIKIIKEKLKVYETEVTSNQLLLRAEEFYFQKQFTDAKELLKKVELDSLNKFDSNEYMLLKFKLENIKKDSDFNNLKNFFNSDSTKLKELYFSYIKYLEDIRDEKNPKRLIKEFENRYPISDLSQEEKSLYYYLKGRGEYARGDFLLALKNLSISKENTQNDNKKFLASIDNTTSNSFNDNLFFQEALELATSSLDTREMLKLSEKQESLSLLGGIYFKSNQLKKSYESYKASLTLLDHDDKKSYSRLYNYLAKVSIFLGYHNKAKEYILKAKEYEDRKGFTVLIEMLYYYSLKEYENMLNIYKESFFFLEKREEYDYFVIGWGYTLIARSLFDEKKYDEGVEYLYKAMDYFLEDKYIVEAYYISLYVYQYNISESSMDKFFELIESFELNKKMKEYVFKHKNISSDYAKLFDINIGNEDNLLALYEETSYLNRDNYYPEVVKDVLDKFNLI